MTTAPLSIETLKNRFLKYFQQNKPQPVTADSSLRQAAVLILIYPGKTELELILTRRSEHLPHHAGQISLPGGSVEAEDKNTTHTALREAEEEIGLKSAKVDVLGTMNQLILPSGFAVTPVVGVIEKAQQLQADPGEVQEIFSIPLSLVLDNRLYQQDSYIRNGIKRKFYYFDYKEYYVWGATAGILRELAILNFSK